MDQTHLPAPEPTPGARFVKGMRAVFGTTKPDSDRQLAEEAERRKKQVEKTDKK
jgi:hypothetical protein